LVSCWGLSARDPFFQDDILSNNLSSACFMALGRHLFKEAHHGFHFLLIFIKNIFSYRLMLLGCDVTREKSISNNADLRAPVG